MTFLRAAAAREVISVAVHFGSILVLIPILLGLNEFLPSRRVHILMGHFGQLAAFNFLVSNPLHKAAFEVGPKRSQTISVEEDEVWVIPFLDNLPLFCRLESVVEYGSLEIGRKIGTFYTVLRSQGPQAGNHICAELGWILDYGSHVCVTIIEMCLDLFDFIINRRSDTPPQIARTQDSYHSHPRHPQRTHP